jgi:Protein of unknown function (DUF3592)
MATVLKPRRPGKTAGLVFLFGYFMLFCAFLMLLTAGWRAYRTHNVESRWIETPAHIKKCSLGVYHPFVRDGGGVLFSLRCRLGYEFASRPYEYAHHTTGDRSPSMHSSIKAWITHNPPGTILIVKVNPSNPKELVVKSDLPIHQFRSAREALLTATVFAAPGLLLIAIGHKLARRGRPDCGPSRHPT